MRERHGVSVAEAGEAIADPDAVVGAHVAAQQGGNRAQHLVPGGMPGPVVAVSDFMLIGVEIAGATKNVIALAAGVVAGNGSGAGGGAITGLSAITPEPPLQPISQTS